LLEKTFQEKKLHQFSDLEKEGIIKRFEYTFELAWKTLKDYLESSGVVLMQITPKQVIKEAFAAKIIENGQAWMEMLESRNSTSHEYDKEKCEQLVEAIASKYVFLLQTAFLFFKKMDATS
jgi:nucleotidyltransferase substrate binding protein (TIGR01987 family)